MPFRHKWKTTTWLGKYQAWYLTLYGRQRFYMMCYKLERFFDQTPRHTFLTQYTEDEIHDWSIKLKANGTSEKTIPFYLASVTGFFNWCKQHGCHDLFNPAYRLTRRVTPKTDHSRRRKPRVMSFADLQAICHKATHGDFLHFIMAFIDGRIAKADKKPYWIFKEFRVAAEAAGLDYRLSDMRHSIDKLRCGVLQHLNDKVGDALLSESQLLSPRFRYVKTPASNVRPAVINTTHYFPPSCRVRNKQKSPKGQALVSATDSGGVEPFAAGSESA